MATLIAACGLEHGTHAGLATGANAARYFDRMVGTAGTNVEVVAAAARSGDYGLRLSPSAAIAHAGWANTGNSGILTAGTLVTSFWFRFPTSLPSSDFNIFIAIGTAGGQDAYLKYLSSTTGLQGILGASTQLGPLITADTWYRADLRVVLNANPHTLDWQIGGATQPQVSLAAASEDLFIAGFSVDNATQQGVLHVDDAALSLTGADYPLGSHKVLALTVDPAATVTLSGTAGNFQTFAGTTPTKTAWNATTARNNVDERPPNLGTSQDGFCQITTQATNYVQTPMTTYTLQSGESVGGARLVACCWAQDATAGTIGFRSHNGTTERILFAAANPSANNTATPAWVCKMLTLADIDTQTELDALAIRTGFSSDATPDEGVHAIYVELAVKESAGLSGAVGQASETGTAQAVGKVKVRQLGLAVEDDTANQIRPTHARVLGQPSDATSALAVGRAKGRTAGQPADTNTAQLAGRAKSKTAGQPGDTGTAVGLGRRHSAVLGQASDTATSRPLGRSKRKDTGEPAESVSVQLIERSKRLSLAQPSETDTAQPITSGTPPLGQPAEADTVLPIRSVKQRAVAQPNTVDQSRPIGSVKARLLNFAVDLSTALDAARHRTRTLQVAGETSDVQPTSRTKAVTVALASETSDPLAVTEQAEVQPRPDEGDTDRPFAGIIARPSVGVTTRPDEGTTFRP